jgi:hypothetical protein
MKTGLLQFGKVVLKQRTQLLYREAPWPKCGTARPKKGLRPPPY